ncbi:uncharacterized protein LOC110848918 [Folsomia candida]|uniref:uncharacterized protein LOC110848918 n=1 Tax=Folsomia candida TaxID=158441 RepID=UPI000B900E66|nr:uncharacterized protein LOC110848918 [Folsomia candida]
MRAIKVLIFTVLVVGVSALDKVTAPSRDLFIGDFESFTCETSSGPNLKWVYKFKDSMDEVLDSDILRDKRISEHESFIRKSLIRVPRALESISCYDATKHSEVGNAPVSVNDFNDVDILDDPTCQDVPKITLVRWNQFSNNHIWLNHYVTNEDVRLEGIRGIKLTCMSNMKVNWTISHKTLREFRYWTSSGKECYFASLVLSPINPTSAQKFICTGNDKDHVKKESSVNIILPPTRYADETVLDFNKTQECIEYLGTTVFGSQTLAWSTAGSSMLSIGMMVGIVFLKKQLEKQKTNNNSGGAQPVPA